MSQFFAKEWMGAAFILFGPAHLVSLGIIVLFNIILVLWGRRASEPQRKVLRWSLAGVLFFNELAWHVWNIYTGQWTLQTMLPLHLCSILVFVSIFMLITRSKNVYPYAYFLGIAGALQALLTPDAGNYGFPHFRAFQTMISHGLIITTAIYMTVVEGFRPTLESARRVFIGTNIYMVVIFFFNLLIGSNYLFIAHKPETASLLDVLPPWPWYILVIELIGLVCIVILYLPYAVKDWRNARKRRI